MDQNLRDKTNEAMKSPIVGNYLFGSDEIDQLYALAENAIPRLMAGGYFTSLPNKDDVFATFVALVNASKDWGSTEDSFYQFLDRKIKAIYIRRELVVGLVDYLKDHNVIYSIKSGKKYYATMLSHSLSPISSTESFFEMCWAIYSKDLLFQYAENDPVLKLIIQNLQFKFRGLGADDDVSIGSKVYSFRIGLVAMINEQPEIARWLLDDVLHSMDCLFSNTELASDTYLHVLLKEWWSKKLLEFGQKLPRKERTSRERVAIDYSQIKARYRLINGTAKIVIPAIRLQEDFNQNPRIHIYLNDQLVIDEELETYGSGVIMTTKQKEYDLKTICRSGEDINVRIEITYAAVAIYDSIKSLFREFVLFANDKEVTTTECKPGNYFLYANGLSQLIKYPNSIQRTDINTYSIFAAPDDVIQGKSRIVFFAEEDARRDYRFVYKEIDGLRYVRDGEEYKVIDGELVVVVRADTDIKDIGVKYEGAAPIHLSELPCELVDDQRRYELSILYNVAEPQKITVFRFSDNSILSMANIVKFKNIRKSFDQLLYYGHNITGKFSFKTEKYDIVCSFVSQKGKVGVPLEGGELIATIPLLKWKIDDGEWQVDQMSKGLWYENISNSSILYVDLPLGMEGKALINGQEIATVGTDDHCFKLGQTSHAIAYDTQNKIKSATVQIKANTGKLFTVGTLYFKETFVGSPLVVSSLEKTVIWNPECYIGAADSRFKLEVLLDNRLVFETALSMDGQTFDFSSLGDGECEYSIDLEPKGIFSRNVKRLYYGSFFLGDKNKCRFNYKMLRINQIVSLDKTTKRIQTRTVYIDHIKYIGEDGGLYCYYGSLFVLDRNNKKRYLNYMYGEDGSSKKINPVRIELKSDQSCYLGYGYDFEEDEYDNEFMLDCDRKLSIDKMCRGTKSIFIDYYLFTVDKHV